jgi:dTMP kinase
MRRISPTATSASSAVAGRTWCWRPYIFTAFARDTVRGCPPDWVRGIYNFAALPDLTFFFNAPLEVSLQRILDGRPQLKYFEAGMDLRLSSDPYESFRIFQGRILEQYLAMTTEFGFLVMDANEPVEAQQSIVLPKL